jgi:hypothetical protein
MFSPPDRLIANDELCLRRLQRRSEIIDAT